MDMRNFEVAVQAALYAAGFDDAIRDGDGDWVVRTGAQALMLRAANSPVPHLHVWTGVARKLGPECLTEVNRINASTVLAKLVYFDDGDLFAVAQVTSPMMSPEGLLHAIAAVASVSEAVEPLFLAMFRDAC